MKVLFAVSNEEISESIVKRYQREYKEIISYKNVYYFNAILKELQKDKSYDRVVISEELEAFTNTQYTQIDKFIFEKLDNISDEASNIKGDDIPIIVICSDRREKSEEMLVKLFGIGIYDALLGNDRSVDNVCNLLNKPRLKKEAKSYYKIDSDDVSYQAENENDVSEIEIQNILAHYKRLGKDEKRYIDSFDNIASQYNDVQLRIISKFLPLNVRAVLEEKSTKYQQIISYNNKVSDNLRSQNVSKEKEGTSAKLLNSQNGERTLSKPVVIPSSVNMSSAKKLAKTKNEIKPIEPITEERIRTDIKKVGPAFEETIQQTNQYEQNINPSELITDTQSELIDIAINELETELETEPPKKKRGRPRKNPIPEQTTAETPKRGRGRPRKNPIPEDQERLILPNINKEDDDEDEDILLPGFDIEETILPGFQKNDDEEETILPGFEEEENNTLPGFEEEENNTLPGFEEDQKNSLSQENGQAINNFSENNYKYGQMPNQNYNNDAEQQENMLKNINSLYKDIDISNLLTSDKKVACFIGTTKNGTSFIVNNLAEISAKMGIDTAILDTTANRNSYYIYTKNEEYLRKIAMESVNNLLQGEAKGIKVGNNLNVYTSLPDETQGIENAGRILQTLLKRHSLVLIDCDFETPAEYFEKAQEIYLVQSFDILTIQPLTAFLRDLKSKNILKEEKLRVVLNKEINIRGINEKTIIGGMAYYNDPAMSFMTELFDKNTIRYITVPFSEEVYAKYLENVINCEVSVRGYPKSIIQTFNRLSNMVYPLLSGKSSYTPPKVEKSTFTSSMNSTLDQMKNKY